MTDLERVRGPNRQPDDWIGMPRARFDEIVAAARREERARIREMLLSISAEHDEAGRLRESEALDNAVDRALPLTPEKPE